MIRDYESTLVTSHIYLGSKMEDKKPQNKTSASNYSKSETYHSKSTKQKKRSSLVKRRNTAITLSVISSVILAGIGYEIVTNLNNEGVTSDKQAEAKVPLRILSEEEDYISFSPTPAKHSDLDFDEEVNIIQQLTKHKNLQSKKIRELKEELEEAQARIVQLKTDILIKGGEKEQYYRDQIDQFNKQLTGFEQENSNLQAEVAIRDKLIESKRVELERLSKIFTDTHDQLQNELSNRDSEIEQQMMKTERIFEELKEELALTENEIKTPADVREALRETTKRIAELEGIIEEANVNSIEANDHAEDLTENLLTTQRELAEARQTIQNLVTKIESKDLANTLLKGNASEYHDNYELTQNTLLQKQQELEKVERRLQQALVDYTNEKSRADDLFNKLTKLESSQLNQVTASNLTAYSYAEQGGNMSSVVRQQERLIKDLQRNLKSVERRNSELEQLLAESRDYVQEYDNDVSIRNLKQELFNSQQKVRELESDLQQLKLQPAKDPTPYTNSGDSELNTLLNERSALLAEVYEYRAKISEKQDTIDRLERELQVTSNSHNDPEVERLRSKISLLERTLSDTEHRLEQAVANSADETENTGLLEMEEFYETKLSQLAKTNQILEEQLEEAEEYIKLTQDQISKDQEQITSLQNQFNRAKITTSNDDHGAIRRITQQLQEEIRLRESLELELTQLRDRFSQSNSSQYSYNDRSNSQVLKEQIQELEFLYNEEKERSTQLELQLETLSRMTSSLQEEIKAHEAVFTNTSDQSTPSRLRAKIAYLTTRLGQEKSKLMNSEEKLQELTHTMNEMRQRNRQLESQLY